MPDRPLTLARPRKRRRRETPAEVMERLLRHLASSPDPLVSGWAKKLRDEGASGTK